MTEKEIDILLPRIVVAGTSSGSGKTTVTCALLGALKKEGMDPVSFKCGPDYLDPMFHQSVIGIDSANLDTFFLDGKAVRNVLYAHAKKRDLAVLEGVMGYYDGTGTDGMDNSTFHVANATLSPVILVVNGRGAFTSVLAQIYGFLHYVPDSRIKGVIINQVSKATYHKLENLIRQRFGEEIKTVGYLPVLPTECVLESRHLGLVAAGEIESLKEKLTLLTEIARETLDSDDIISIARQAEGLRIIPHKIPFMGRGKIAVAMDRAFCFYYSETFRLLEKLGAELVFFSPLNNEEIPVEASGLLLGGGYPELYAKTLSEAERTKLSIKDAVRRGMPVIAECGGFMYLCRSLEGYPMCDILPGDCHKTEKLVRFGYVKLDSGKEGLFGSSVTVRGHEFHYCDCTDNGEALTACKTNGTEYTCGFYDERMYAGYPHLYLGASQEAAENFYGKCLNFQRAMLQV